MELLLEKDKCNLTERKSRIQCKRQSNIKYLNNFFKENNKTLFMHAYTNEINNNGILFTILVVFLFPSY